MERVEGTLREQTTAVTEMANRLTQLESNAAASASSIPTSRPLPKPSTNPGYESAVSAFELLQNDTSRGINEIIDLLKAAEDSHLARHAAHSRLSRWLRWLPITHPDDRPQWVALSLVVHSAALILSPLRLGFPEWFASMDNAWGMPWTMTETAFDVIFFVDCLQNFRTAFYTDGRTVIEREPAAIVRHYLSTLFLIDLISSCPAGLAAKIAGTDAEPLRLLKLLRFLNLYILGRDLMHQRTRLIRRTLGSITPTSALTIALLAFVALFWHWTACIWAWLVNRDGGLVVNTEQMPLFYDTAGPAGGLPPRYVTAINWCVAVTTGLGNPHPSMTASQASFETLATIAGCGVEAAFFGMIASAIGQVNKLTRARQEAMTRMREYVQSKAMPTYVRRGILDFYSHRLGSVRPVEEAKLLQDLPLTLRVQLSVATNSPILRRVELFRGAPAPAIALLSLLMKQRTHMPNETIVEQGDRSVSIFCVLQGELAVYVRRSESSTSFGGHHGGGCGGSSGAVEVEHTAPAAAAADRTKSNDGSMTNGKGRKGGKAKGVDDLIEDSPFGNCVAHIRSGAAFGENSFLSGDGAMSSVRTVTYCDLLSFTRDDLEVAYTHYPMLRGHIHSRAAELKMRYADKNQNALVRRARRPSFENVLGHTAEAMRRTSQKMSEFIVRSRAPVGNERIPEVLQAARPNRRSSFAAPVLPPIYNRRSSFKV